MCGIAGIVKYNPNAAVEERRLQAMRDALLHRGPDGAGLVLRGRAGLAHRRLAIIDVHNGSQPMGTADGQTWLSYNGELYNTDALRTQLELAGCTFATRSDTEVLLRAYETWGEDCVHHLRGMFAFAIWDGNAQKLFLARDRLGIKPLYYAADGRELLFGSEIKAILAGRSDKPVFNRAILPAYLAARFSAGADTFFAGIFKLLPGHTLSWTAASGIRTHHYWQPALAQEDDGCSYQDHVQQVRVGLEDAVRSHLVSDVPLGLFLSGGLDSTILAALMAPMLAQQGQGPLQTFSIGFHEAAANELDYARMAATAVGATHREVLLTPAQFFGDLPRLIWHEDEPIAFPSSIPLYRLSLLAKQHVKVVLTGEGADELFLGYDYRYRVTAWNTRLGDRYQQLVPAHLRKAVAARVQQLPRRLRRYVERSFLALPCTPRALFFENFSVFRAGQREALLLDQDLCRTRDAHAEGLRFYQSAGADALQCMSHADMQTYLVELLMKQDQMSMAASLESRVPFLDHRLVEQVAAIPARHRLHGWQTKALLRDAVADLVPPAILRRGKMGFPVPLADWLRGDWRHLVDDFVLGQRAQARGLFRPAELQRLAREHLAGHANHADKLWLLINLEIWQRIFIDGEEPGRVFNDSSHAAARDAAALRQRGLALQ